MLIIYTYLSGNWELNQQRLLTKELGQPLIERNLPPKNENGRQQVYNSVPLNAAIEFESYLKIKMAIPQVRSKIVTLYKSQILKVTNDIVVSDSVVIKFLSPPPLATHQKGHLTMKGCTPSDISRHCTNCTPSQCLGV